MKEAGKLVPVDVAWHSVCILVTGDRHRVSVDGKLLFDGAADVSVGGKLCAGPGWGSWNVGLPYVDIDDIIVKRTGAD